MEIRQLKTFKTAVELNSFSKAAKELSYGQSTVTEHIQALERQIGRPLFDRIGKRIVVTETGRELYGYAVEMMEICKKIENISADGKGQGGRISVGASESLIAYRLQPALSSFTSQYPNVSISLVSGTCSDLREKLRLGEIDLAVTLEPYREDCDLAVEKVGEEEMLIVSSPSQQLLKIGDAKESCFIFTEKECALRRFFENYLYNQGINPSSRLEFSNMEAIKQCVAGGLGIAMLPKMTVECMVEKNSMAVLETGADSISFDIRMSRHKNKWVSPLLEDFEGFCREALSDF